MAIAFIFTLGADPREREGCRSRCSDERTARPRSLRPRVEPGQGILRVAAKAVLCRIQTQELAEVRARPLAIPEREVAHPRVIEGLEMIRP